MKIELNPLFIASLCSTHIVSYLRRLCSYLNQLLRQAYMTKMDSLWRSYERSMNKQKKLQHHTSRSRLNVVFNIWIAGGLLFTQTNRAAACPLPCRRWRSNGQGDHESGSLAELALHSDVALMKRYDLLDDGKSHTAAAILSTMGAIGFKESLEDALLVFKGDPNTRIGDVDCHIFWLFLLCSYRLFGLLNQGKWLFYKTKWKNFYSTEFLLGRTLYIFRKKKKAVGWTS